MVEVDFVATTAGVEGLWVDRENGVVFAALGTAGFDAWRVDINNPDDPDPTGALNIGFLSDIRNQLGDLNTAGTAYDVQFVAKTVIVDGAEVQKGYAYVADGLNGLRIIDVSALTDPALADNADVFYEVGDYNTPGDARAVRVVGDYAYIADGASGLQIVDISNPSAPELVGQFDVDNLGFAYDVDVIGPFAYVADGTNGVHVIDILDPTNPIFVETLNTDIVNAKGIQVADNVLFVADDTDGVQRFDVSTYTDRNVTLSVASSEDPLSATVNEGGTADLIYTFSLPKVATEDVVINYRIRQPQTLLDTDTIASQDDFTGATSGDRTITIAAGQSSVDLRISPSNDTLVEQSESLSIELLPGTDYYPITTEVVTATILDNDIPSISLTASGTNLNENSQDEIVYTFTRSNNPQGRLTVYYSIGGTASSSDYNGAQPGSDQTITFRDPATVRQELLNDPQYAQLSADEITTLARQIASTQTITITPVDNDEFEGDKTITVNLEPDPRILLDLPPLYQIGGSSSTVTTIREDESPPPTVVVSLSPNSVLENAAEQPVYTFSLFNDAGVQTSLNQPLTVTFNLGSSSATRGTDYTVADSNGNLITGNSFVIAAGSIQSTLIITPVEDTDLEPNETVSLVLVADDANYNIGTPAPFVGTIVNINTYDPNAEPFEPDNVFVRGNYAYTVDENGLTVSDVQTPTNPNPDPQKYFFRATGATSVQVFRDYAYIGDESGIRVVSVSDPSAMEQVDFVATPQPVEGLWVDRTRGVVFASLGNEGFSAWQVDINNPDAVPLVPLGTLNTAGFANDVFTLGDFAYIADGDRGLRIINIANLDDPALADNVDVFFEVGDYNTPGNAQAVKVVGNYAYIADGAIDTNGDGIFDVPSSLQIIDISNPSSPFLAGQIDVLDADNNIEIGNAVDVDVIGPFAYVSDGAAGVHVIDILDPTAPVFVETFDTPGNALGVQVADNVLFVADVTGGLQEFDVSQYTDRNVTLSLNWPDEPNVTWPNQLTEEGTAEVEVEVDVTNPDGTIGTQTQTETRTPGVFTYTFSLPKPAAEDITIRFNIRQPATPLEQETIALADDPNSTIDPRDYTSSAVLDANGNGTVIIRAGETTATLLITPTSDSLVENTESIIVTLLPAENGTDYRIGTSEAVVSTITSDDLASVSLRVSPTGSIEEGGTITYTFERTGLPLDSLTVFYEVGGLADTNDYQVVGGGSLNGEITFDRGQTIQTIVLQTIDDLAPEETETIEITLLDRDPIITDQLENSVLSAAERAALLAQDTYRVSTQGPVVATILDNEPEVTVTLTPSRISETSDGTLAYTFTLSRAVTEPIEIRYIIAGGSGSATFDDDYTLLSGSANVIGVTETGFTITSGDTATILVDPTPGTSDDDLEGDETISLTLDDGTGYTIGTTSAIIGTIANVDTFDPNTEPFEPDNVFVRGNYAYTVDENGLTVSDVQTPTNPNPDPQKYFFRATGATSVQVIRDYAYIGDASGIRVVSISDPSAMEQVDFVATPEAVQGLWVDRTRGVVFASLGDEGFSAWQVDINNPDAVPLTPLGTLNTAGFANDVFTLGNFAYIADGDRGLRIINISNLDDPALADNVDVFYEVGDYNTPGDAQAVKVVGNYAYVADGASGLQIIDISNPSAPVFVGEITVLDAENNIQIGNAVDVDVVGPFAYVSDGAAGVHVIDILDPNNPELVETFDTPGNARGIQVADNILFVADGTGGVQQFDVSTYTDRNVTLSVASSEDPLSATVNEGGTADLIYTFSLPKVATEDVVINYRIRQPQTLLDTDTIASGSDFTGATPGDQTITIAAGQSSVDLRISPSNDSLVEQSESFSIGLLPGTDYYPITTEVVTATILDNDIPSISLTASGTNLNENSQDEIVYTFTRSNNPQGRLTIYYSIGGTASSTDYDGAQPGVDQTITFRDPATVRQELINDPQYAQLTADEITELARQIASTQTITITPVDNDEFEGDKTITVSLQVDPRTLLEPPLPPLYQIGGSSSTVTTIREDDSPPPTVVVSLSPTSILENAAQQLVYTFSLFNDAGVQTSLNQPLTINFNLGSSSATRGTDYTVADSNGNLITGNSFVISANSSQATLLITPVEDTDLEPNETVSLVLVADDANYNIGTPTPFVGTIVNIDTYDPNAEPFEPDNVFVRGNYAYTVDENGLTVSDVQTPTNPNPDPQKYFFRATGATSVQVFRDYAYIGDASGIRVVSVSDPSAMEQVDFVATPQPVEGLWVDRTRGVIFASLGDEGFAAWQVDINNPDAVPLVPLGTLNTAGFANDVFTLGDFAYIADGDRGLRIISNNGGDPALADNPDPDFFFEVGDYNTSGDAQAVKVVGNYAYIADGASGLQIINISNASRPSLTGRLDVLDADNNIGFAYDLEVNGDFAYIADGANGIHWIDISDPTQPTFKRTFNTPGTAIGLQYVEGILYVADEEGGLQAIPIPIVSLSTSSNLVQENESQKLVYTFSLPAALQEDLTVTYKVSGGAENGIDYSALVVAPNVNEIDADGNGTLTIQAGQKEAQLEIVPIDDIDLEGPETVAITLQESNEYVVSTTDDVIGTISEPQVSVRVSPTEVAEDGEEKLIYTFSMLSAALTDLTINYSLGGAATANDYTGATPGNNTITIRQGQTQATLGIDPTPDNTVESDETVIVELLPATDGTYVTGTSTLARGTITNDDQSSVDPGGGSNLPQVTLSVSPESLAENSSEGMVFTVSLAQISSSDIAVNYRISGTATAEDYTGAIPGDNQTLTIAAGSPEARLTINPIDDGVLEDDETVILTLLAGTGYSLGSTDPVVGTIINYEKPLPQVSVALSSTSVQENSTDGMTYTFSLDAPAENDLVINFNLGGTASAADYTGATPGDNQTLSIAAGQTQASLTIRPVDDDVAEADETVVLTLGSGDGYTASTTDPLTGTIVNYTRSPKERLTTVFYRFQNLDRPGTYLFAAGEEAANLRINHPNFKEEGFAFAAASAKTDPLLRTFYRFQNTDPGREGTYLYVGEQEAASLRQNYHNFKEEGIAFFAYDFGFGQGTIDFARFENINLPGTYLFTGPSETQSLVLSSTFGSGSGYSYGGLAFAAAG